MYFTKKMQNHHGGLILVDGHLYGCDDRHAHLPRLQDRRGEMGATAAPASARCCTPTGCSTAATRTGRSAWSRPRPKASSSRAASTSPTAATRSLAAPGHRQRHDVRPRPGRAAVLRRARGSSDRCTNRTDIAVFPFLERNQAYACRSVTLTALLTAADAAVSRLAIRVAGRSAAAGVGWARS